MPHDKKPVTLYRMGKGQWSLDTKSGRGPWKSLCVAEHLDYGTVLWSGTWSVFRIFQSLNED